MHNANAKQIPSKGAKILARSFFKELRENGYGHNEILSTELIDLLAEEIRGAEVAPRDGKVVELRKSN